MNEREHEAMKALLKKARKKRDDSIEKAHSDFDMVLADAYQKGFSLHDLHFVTGLAVSTLRVRLRLAGVSMRDISGQVDVMKQRREARA